MDRKIFIDLVKKPEAKVGHKQANAEDNPEIMLSGVTIKEQHAVFTTNDDKT